MDNATAHSKSFSLPLPIRSWLSSEESSESIIKIVEQFHIPGTQERVIPVLILQLVVGGVTPKEFTGELASQLAVDRDNAKLVAGAIYQLVFAPIKDDLARLGIDISLIERTEIPLQTFQGNIPVPSSAVPTSAIRPPVAMPSMPVKMSPAPSSAPTTPYVLRPSSGGGSASGGQSSPMSAPAPFVLHTETNAIPVKPRTTFKIEIPQSVAGDMRQVTGQKGINASAPARIEFGKPPMPAVPPKPVVARTESEAPRIVHYAQPTSPTTPYTLNPKPSSPSGPMPLSAIGIPPMKPPAPRPSLDVPLEKPSVPMAPPPRPPGH